MSTNQREDPYRDRPDTAFLSKTDIIRWEEGRTFHSDWAAHNFFQWAELLHGLRDRPVRILEIGSWEGRSALFFLNFLPHSTILCIDPFAGNAEHQRDPYWVDLARKSEQQFDHNLAGYESRVEKVVGSSADVLPRLGAAGRRFDLAYIDGSHLAADVYRDGVLVWSLLDRAGIALFDDYEWPMMDTPEQRPKLGVDRFLAAHAGQYREIHRDYQLAIEKL
jgi:predicted O-methyltransferase YrrM